MKVLRLSVPYDKLLALGGPDPITGLVDIYLAPQDVPVGTFAHAVVKDIPAQAAVDLGADMVRDVFRDAPYVDCAGGLRAGIKKLYMEGST